MIEGVAQTRAMGTPLVIGTLYQAVPVTWGVNGMKSIFIGLALAATALSVNAGDVRSTVVPSHVYSNAPVCPEGQVAVAHFINGRLVWECVPA